MSGQDYVFAIKPNGKIFKASKKLGEHLSRKPGYRIMRKKPEIDIVALNREITEKEINRSNTDEV